MLYVICYMLRIICYMLSETIYVICDIDLTLWFYGFNTLCLVFGIELCVVAGIVLHEVTGIVYKNDKINLCNV